MRPTPEQLWKYANAYARQHELLGDGTQYPLVSRCAQRFRCTQEVIREVADEDFFDSHHYLGTASYYCQPEEPLGKHVVEAY